MKLPLIWEYADAAGGGWQLYDATGERIAWVATEDDAAYIVKAVNNHADLLKALEAIAGEGAQFGDYCDEAEHDEDSGCIFCEARAAIKKAKT